MASGLAAVARFSVFGRFSNEGIVAITALAAGTVMADTMIPEAFEEGHDFIGLITVLGFLTAFLLIQLTNG